MKRISILVVLMLLVTSSCFAWTKVAETDDGYFTVNEQTISHYTAKGNFPATSGSYNYYNYSTNVESSYFVRIKDADLSYIEVSVCYWVNGKKTSCDAIPRFKQIYKGSNGETLMQWMVDYRKLTRGDDVM